LLFPGGFARRFSGKIVAAAGKPSAVKLKRDAMPEGLSRF
jgi:hypothetical protein